MTWPRTLRLAAALFGALFSALFAALPLVGAGSAGAAQEATWLTLRAGTISTTVDGVTHSGPVELDYHWDRMQNGHPGVARIRLPFVLPEVPWEPWGIFVPRAGSSLEVHLNGSLLQQFGDLLVGGDADYAKSPIYVPVPAHLLNAGQNELQIDLRADSGRRAGLAAITIGPAREVRAPLYETAFAWRFTGAVFLAVFSIVVGVIALALWLTQEDPKHGDGRRDNLYLWAAVAAFCWALRVADGAIRHPPLPWVEWGTLMTVSYSGWACAVVIFCQHLAGWQDARGARWARRLAGLVVVGSAVVCYLALSAARPEWMTRWLAFELVAVTGYFFLFAAATVRRPTPMRLLVSLMAALTIAAAARDWAVIRMAGDYAETAWIRYPGALFGWALLLIMVSRFRSATTRARELARMLALRVAARDTELALAYGLVEQGAREQGRTQERERILRDMHDGVGSHISAAIRQLQSGRASHDEVLHTLRDSLAQLKMSIDTMNLPEGDVGALLAGMRYRMQSRFAASDVALEWAVGELQPLARLDKSHMQQLQFLMFEAISNALQHAQASILRIEAAMIGPILRLGVIDNGRGFDAVGITPRALGDRARAIGATLAVESRPGRTVVRIEFGA